MVDCTRIDLLRHGECEGGHRFRGHNDVPLTSLGLAQMQKASARAAPWNRVVSSPLQRCRVFADTLAGSMDVSVDPRLMEIGFGDWEGRPVEEVWRTDSTVISAWSRDPTSVTPPGGEPLVQVAERVMSCFTELLALHRGQKLLLVTHGGVIRVLLSQILGMPLSCATRLHVPFATLASVAVYQSDDRPGGDLIKLLGHNWASEDMEHG
jgi:alpha-ribazole phosphatase